MRGMLERLVRGVLVATLLVVGGGGLSGCGLNLVTTSHEISMGNQFAPQFLSEGGGEIPDEEVLSYVREIGQKLLAVVPSAESRELPWEFHVLNSDVLNAFALPGGKVFISRGLMVRLSNEAELAAVLGHEIGHVNHEHIGKQMTHSAIQSGVINAAVGVAGQMSDSQWIQVLGAGAQTGGQLYLLRFGRTQELEADDEGLRLMVLAGYDPAGMVGVLEVLRDAAGGGSSGLFDEILSTHPDPGRRVGDAEAAIRERYGATQGNGRYVLNAAAYERRALAPIGRLGPAADAGGGG